MKDRWIFGKNIPKRGFFLNVNRNR
ncbi:hypothetical protein CY0110_16622 [Crocosphaera chwakensis CCY0110]|uniref:Uncharacterized protein n=1 Tax=Crocosphaera chwakensis CCY0110 TaxID=391612 RepID=A3II06_9CHRO|nr:hypothetical protein CY0110_16622 [Crocosphaera chwakensis CCY0110]